jgi:glycosyltransferase involved in cell wall biosynthesis
LSDIDRQIFTSLTKRQLTDEFDIIHVNSRPQFLRVAESFDAPMTIKMNGPPHSLVYDHLLPGTSSYDFFELADAVIGTGETPDLIAERTGLDVHTINPGVDTTIFIPNGPVVDLGDGPTLLWVGRFVPAKDLSLLIKSFNELQESCPDASAYLIGDGPKQTKIKQIVEKHDLTDSVQFLGRIDHDELPKYYRSADVFTLTSQTENHPIAMMEAMSSATPPVAPSVGWIPKMIDDGQDGIVVENRTPSAFANAWKEVLTDSSERDRLGTRARDTARTQFEWENKAKGLLDIFQSVLST